MPPGGGGVFAPPVEDKFREAVGAHDYRGIIAAREAAAAPVFAGRTFLMLPGYKESVAGALAAVIAAGGGTALGAVPSKSALAEYAAEGAAAAAAATGVSAALDGGSSGGGKGRGRASAAAAAPPSIPGLIVFAKDAAQVEEAAKDAAAITAAGLPIYSHTAAVTMASLCQSLQAALGRGDAVLRAAAAVGGGGRARGGR